MGKITTLRNKGKKRVSPTGLDTTQVNIPAENEQQVLPILQKLTSTSADDRAWSACALSSLIESIPLSTRQALLKSGLIQTLVNGLSDTVEDVRVEMAGALRNWCLSDLQDDLVKECWRLDIKTPVIALFDKVSNTSSSEPWSSLTISLLDSLLTLVWTLAEHLPEATQAFTSSSILPFLVAMVSQDTQQQQQFPRRLVVTAMQVISTIADENKQAQSMLVSCIPHFMALLCDNDAEYSLLSASVLYHLRNNDQVALDKVLSSVIRSLRNVITSTDLKTLKTKMEEAENRPVNVNTSSEEMQDEEQAPTQSQSHTLQNPELEALTEQYETSKRVLTLGLEVLANLCSDEVAADSWEDVDDVNMEDDAVVEEEDMEMVTDSANDIRVQMVVEADIPQLLFTLLNSVSEFSDVLVRTLAALSNIWLLLSTQELPPQSIAMITSSWPQLFTFARTSSDTETIDTILSALIAITRLQLPLSTIVSQEQVNDVLHTASNPQTPHTIRLKTLPILSAMAQQTTTEINSTIGEFLLNAITHCAEHSEKGKLREEVEIIAEAADAFVDTYADETKAYDVVFQSGGYIDKVRSVLPKIRAKVKLLDKRRARQTRDRADETLYNLKGLMDYKEKIYKTRISGMVGK